MKKAIFILLLISLCLGNAYGQTLDTFIINRTTQPYQLYVRIALPNNSYKISQFVERNLQSARNTQIYSFMFKDCPGGNSPAYYDTTINIDVTQYTKLFEVQINILLDENNDPNCTLRPAMIKTDSLYMTGAEVMSVNEELTTHFKLYPIPAQKILHIQTAAKISKYVITDLTGRILTTGFDNTKSINIDLPDGLYLLHLHTTEGNTVKKFTVAN